MTYLLGVDAGNTKTIALVSDQTGRILGAGRGGCGDIYAHLPETAFLSIEAAVQAALDAASVRCEEIASSGFSMAGADWPEDYALLESAMRARGYGQDLVVTNDAIGALRAGTPEGWGVAVVCGTGTATGARSPEGRIWHSSFWQVPDSGGQSLGQSTLAAVCHAELGILPPTLLTARVLDFYRQESVPQLLHLLTHLGHPPLSPPLSKLARILLDASQEGDLVAGNIVREHGTYMANFALAAARQVGIIKTAFPLVLTGGVFRHPSTHLIDSIIGHMRGQAPSFTPIQSHWEPVAGALLLAMDAAGISVDDAIRAQISATLPSVSFFKT